MRKENWNYIADNWASTDIVVQEQISKFMDEDQLEHQELLNKIEERDKRILELDRQNRDLNNNNMALFLRMTDPKLANEAKKLIEEPKIPMINDYEAFVKL